MATEHCQLMDLAIPDLLDPDRGLLLETRHPGACPTLDLLHHLHLPTCPQSQPLDHFIPVRSPQVASFDKAVTPCLPWRAGALYSTLPRSPV